MTLPFPNKEAIANPTPEVIDLRPPNLPRGDYTIHRQRVTAQLAPNRFFRSSSLYSPPLLLLWLANGPTSGLGQTRKNGFQAWVPASFPTRTYLTCILGTQQTWSEAAEGCRPISSYFPPKARSPIANEDNHGNAG